MKILNNTTEVNKEIIIQQIQQLQTKAMVYSDYWGPNSDEVKQIDNKISQLNAQYLDLMMES